jgi:glycosyltransferase involved in cell wall biosynthesis
MPQVDYLLTESPPLFLGMSGYLLSRLKRARWIFNVSDLWPESAVQLGLISEGWGLSAAWALEAFCYRKAWLVTGQSREILENIRERFPTTPTWHLSNGVDTDLFQPDRERASKYKDCHSNKCVAIYAGLHGIAQGLDQLLRAALCVRDQQELQLVLVGDGPEKSALVGQASAMGLTNVLFHNSYPRSEMPGLLARSDIALVSLKQHLPGAVPSKLYEAMSAGLPVVLIADGEAANIVRESGCGVVVRPGDIDGLAAALRELCTQTERRMEMGGRGRQAAIARFDRQTIASAFIDRLEEMLQC